MKKNKIQPPPNETKGRPSAQWWGDFTLAENQTAYWQIGPLELWLLHKPHEWNLVQTSTLDPFCSEVRLEIPTERQIATTPHPQRFAIRQRNPQIRITPVCADRPIVSRPTSPFTITAKERVKLYLSTPVWLKIEVGNPARTLVTMPSFRPSDTWFGANTLQGDLCYANRLNAMFNTDDVQKTPHRAITCVEIVNASTSAILLERFSLPLPHFSIFSDKDCTLWTEAATLELTGDEGLAQIRMQKSPPKEAGTVSRQGSAREPISDNFVFRAFSALFTGTGGS